MSIVGRLFLVIAFLSIGVVAGLIVGGFRGANEVSAQPPAGKATLGMESAGMVEPIIFVINVAIGGGIGGVIGLFVGIVFALFWPRRSSH